MTHLGATDAPGGLRDIPTSDFKAWAQRFFVARMASEQRDIKMDAAADEIENDLTLLGCSAIDDQLGEKVPESIASLKQAGIKIWMLTGATIRSYLLLQASTPKTSCPVDGS